jgi:hypothetical protein
VHPRGENLEINYPPRASCMCGRILDRSCREVANQKSRPTRVEHGGYRHDQWSVEVVCKIIGVSLLVLDVQMKLLQIC